MPIAKLISPRSLATTTALMLGILAAGCAQQPVSSSDSNIARDSTLSDAQNKARGREHARATSQIQMGFGDNAQVEAEQTVDQAIIEARQVRELIEPQTFLGTITCPSSNSLCVPQRTTLTTAPSGVWRMKLEAVDASAATHHFTGCWYPVGTEPTRIILQSSEGVSVAELSFVNAQQLRVHSFNQVRPTLDTYLRQQAIIEAIPELDNTPAPVCQTN
ncbi:MAG TPA: hypothetical protein VK026_10515 [Paenalcaligenes sp.]|nr:hypothetical protein [Paenalcaligenes sp.]